MTETLQKLEIAHPPSADASAIPNTLRTLFADCYAGSSWLTGTGIFMLVDTAVSLAGLVLDRTTVMGDPTWLKPLKFGVSVALFSFTVAFMIGQITRFRRFASLLGAIMAVALVLEIVLIDMQAARHTSSHFNIAQKFDELVFTTMGIGISLVLASTAGLFLITCLIRLQDRGLAWAIRLSLALALAGMSTGVLMTLPTPEQKAQLQAGGGFPRSGAHTVGAPDGSRALPLTGWSADHGDLRIAHFVGLHAMQPLLFAWALTRRRKQWSTARQAILIFGTGLSIAAVYAIVLRQALQGQPFLHPDVPILASWTIWALATVSLLTWAFNQHQRTANLQPEAN